MLAVSLGAAALFMAVWAWHERRSGSLRTELERRNSERDIASLKAEHAAETASLRATLEAERKASQERLELLAEARKVLSEEFRALSLEALASNNKRFLELAGDDFSKRKESFEGLVKPVRESLDKLGAIVGDVEKQRIGAYSALQEQVALLKEGQSRLQGETANLVRALRAPQARGQWGEIQLRRVVELAGMQSHCDFVEQSSIRAEEKLLRPDLLVQLPGGKQVVVDAKVALDAYLDAVSATDDSLRLAHLERHAQQVKTHIEQLSRKAYWEQFPNAPEFVVLFLPSETAFGAAVERLPTLIEDAASDKVIIATPTTLIALLRAVYYGWRQEAIAENARQVSLLASQLYDRIGVVVKHLGSLGNSLDAAARNYNQVVGSLESRVLVTARQFRDLRVAGGKELGSLEQLGTAVRTLSSNAESTQENDGA